MKLAKINARVNHYKCSILCSYQSAFVNQRLIHDNLIVAHEAFHYLRAKKSPPSFGLKVDMNKANDRVEWDFLHETLVRMGFNQHWIHMVMGCVSFVSCTVLVNGTPGKSLRPTRGLRQGDPLSPYFFILVCELLSRNIKRAIAEDKLIGLRLSHSCPGISHLVFADDSLFFSTSNLRNAHALKSIISSYCVASI